MVGEAVVSSTRRTTTNRPPILGLYSEISNYQPRAISVPVAFTVVEASASSRGETTAGPCASWAVNIRTHDMAYSITHCRIVSAQ